MKKILIIFLLVSFILFSLQPKIVFSQFGIGEMVPVIDQNAAGALGRINEVLDSILSVTSNELLRLNQTLSEILKTRFEEKANQIFTDSLKEEEYQDYTVNLLKFIQAREEMAKNSESFLVEARKAGAYEGLNSLIENIPCFDPNLREEFTNYVLTLMREFNLLNKTQEILQTIPDCSLSRSGAPSTVYLKPNFFSWLVKPFQLNIAQISSPANDNFEIPPIVITPAFEESERSIVLNDLKFFASSLILGKANESEQTMRQTIDDILPVMRCILDTTEFDDGEYVCLKYQVLISSEQLKQLKQNLFSNNPLAQTTQDINIYQKFIKNENIFKKLGLTSSTVVSISESGGVFINEEEAKKIIAQACASTAASTQASSNTNSTIAYALCLQEFNKKLQQYVEIKRKQLEEIQNYVSSTKEVLEEAQQRAENLKNSLNNCPAAYNDLDVVISELGGKIGLYSKVVNTIFDVINKQINPLRNKIYDFANNINNFIDDIFNQATDVLEVLDQLGTIDIFKSIVPGNISGGISKGLSMIKTIKNKLGKIRTDILTKVNKIVENLDKNLNIFTNIVLKANETNYQLNNSDFSRGNILSDTYQLNLIFQKLEAYERLKQKGGCSSSPAPVISLLNKKQPIIVETKNQKIKSINFLALIKKLWQPKLVEIKNEK